MSTSSRHDLFIFEEQELPGDLWYTPPYSASGVALYSMMTICEVISSQTYGRISLESHSNTWKHRSYYFGPNEPWWLEFPMIDPEFKNECKDFNLLSGII